MNRFVYQIFKQTFWQSIVKLITTTSGFITIAIITRSYSPSEVGSFTLALTYLAFFYMFVDFGFNAHVLSNLQEKTSEIEWRKLLGVRIIWSLLLIVIAVAILPLLPFSPPSFGFSDDFKLTVVLGTITILFFALNLTAHALFQAKLHYQLDIFPTILGVSLGTLSVYLFSVYQVPVYQLVLGNVVAWGVHAFGTIFLARKFTATLLPLFDLSYFKTLFKEVWPLAATLVINTIYFRVDTFILSSYQSLSDVGTYNIAYQFFQSALVLPTFLMNSYYPLMLETLKSDYSAFLRQTKKAFFTLLFSGISVTTATYFLSPFLIQLVTGSGYDGSVKALQILSLGLPAFFISSLLLWILVARKQYKQMLVIYVLGLAFNSGLNLIFIPQYSYIAASWITVISEVFILTLLVYSLKRR